MSAAEHFLPRRIGDSEFTELRREMIERAQSLSGHQWTDYNLHDPGVTIIEQLSYALTDINARSDYEIADLLSDKDVIDLHQQGMFAGDEALPCRPTTLLDYQKYFLDQIDSLQYVIIMPAAQDKNQACAVDDCRYDVYLKPLPSSAQNGIATEDDDELKRELIERFNRVRNLGEDIHRISLIPETPGELIASIEIDDSRAPAEVLADVYLAIDKLLSGHINRIDPDQSEAESPLYQRLEGPLLQYGFIEDDALSVTVQQLPLSMLSTAIRQISGVESVDSLALLLNANQMVSDYLPPLKDACVALEIPATRSALKTQLTRQGKPLEINILEFTHAYQIRRHNDLYQQKSMRLTHMPTRLPHRERDLGHYVSIQTQFPDVYGINTFGIPKSYGQARISQAMQLKAYLALFDQILADHCANLDNIHTLFSLDAEATHSYQTQTLRDAQINNIEHLYQEDPAPTFLAHEPAYEDFADRKSRVLDYLLAMNGQDTYRYGFEVLNPYFNREEVGRIILQCKTQNLMFVHEMSANRAAGYDYTQKRWGTRNLSVLEKHLANILGIEARCRSFVKPLKDLGLEYRSDKGHLYFNPTTSQWQKLDALIQFFYEDFSSEAIERHAENFVRVPMVDTQKLPKDNFLQAFASQLKHLSAQTPDLLLTQGVNLDNYRITRLNRGEHCELLLQQPANGNTPRWQYLGSFDSLKAATQAANQLRHNLVQLNLAMEGLHLMEHILLMPSSTPKDQQHTHDDDAFYAYQVSIVLPNWTTRFSDLSFQAYVETLIRELCPAHLLANILWLDYGEMEAFEILFKNWLDLKHQHTELDKLDKVSALLKEFLQHRTIDGIHQGAGDAKP